MLKLSPLLVGLVVVSSCSQRGELVGAAFGAPVKSPPAIAVGFNHQRHNRYQSPITGDWRDGDDIEQMLVRAINHGQSEILLAVQELSAPKIAEALIAAKRRGVTVRVILENTYSAPWSEQTPSQLKPHQRQRWHQLEQLADQTETEQQPRRKPNWGMPLGCCDTIVSQSLTTRKTAVAAAA